MSNYKWSLRKGGKKERCPLCGKMRFVPFVLTTDPTVKAGPEYGRCDREQSCGYFRYPGSEVRTEAAAKYKPEPKKEPIMMPMPESCISSNDSLWQAFRGLIGEKRLAQAMTDFRCTTGARGETIYPQFDGTFMRTAKAILYGNDGHRAKVEDGGLPVWWLHKSPTVAKWTQGKELRQCFFGQHFLLQIPAAKVYVVESEKTAVLMDATDRKPRRERLWLACGGSQMLKGAIDLMPLIGRDVTLVPDDGQYWNWARTARAYGWRCLDIAPLKALHRLPDGCDIWDCVEDTLKNSKAL